MYHPNDIEAICFQEDHIDRVLAEIRATFPDYFSSYIESEAGQIASFDSIAELAQVLGATATPIKKKTDGKKALDHIMAGAKARFDKDRPKYFEIFDLEAMEEYADDPASFKSTTLRNQCPIIQRTLQNVKAKELDRYRTEFNLADPKKLLDVTTNLLKFGKDYAEHRYDAKSFEQFSTVAELGFEVLDTEDYVVYGVIGGGIKSHFLYKLYPHLFPYRSQDAVWAFWYLTDKKPLGCKQDSEFLMINQKELTTQQNYFYPYHLFAFYALQIFKLLNKAYSRLGVELPAAYRFVLVDSFLQYVANCHRDEIDTLKRQIKEDNYA